ncbi:unnamed protein product, partial [Didymodactylos carnosus]
MNKTLTQLSLQGNQICAQGGEVLGEALKVNPILDQLDLSWNQISVRGVAGSGGLPIDTTILAETVDHIDDKYKLYAEYFAYTCTDAAMVDFKREVAKILDTHIKS